jgi:hypothetical protein
VLSCWPIALWARSLTGDPLAAARVGALWPLVPAPALFVGSIDLALALLVSLAGASLCLALAQSRRSRQLAWSLLGGAAAGAALQTSYGAVVFLAMAAAVALVPPGPEARIAERLAPTAAVAGASAALVALAPVAFGHEPLAALRAALEVHFGLVTARRSYLSWLIHNPVDFALFGGVPLVAMGSVRGLGALHARMSGARVALGAATRRQLVLAAGLAVLILSGSVRGEVGRLWLPLMPLLLIASTAVSAREGNGRSRPAIGESLALGAALAACTLTLRASWGI